jgi:hypothetical protein
MGQSLWPCHGYHPGALVLPLVLPLVLAPHRPSRHGMISEAIAPGTGCQAIVLRHHRLRVSGMAIPKRSQREKPKSPNP